MTDDVPVFLSDIPCKLCGGKEVYSVQYIPDKPDSYAVCANCGALKGDEIVSKE